MLRGRPLVDMMLMSSACSRACRVASPLLDLKVSERRSSLYRMQGSLARDLMMSQACSGVQARLPRLASRIYILRISEADCSMISWMASVDWLLDTIHR